MVVVDPILMRPEGGKQRATGGCTKRAGGESIIEYRAFGGQPINTGGNVGVTKVKRPCRPLVRKNK